MVAVGIILPDMLTIMGLVSFAPPAQDGTGTSARDTDSSVGAGAQWGETVMVVVGDWLGVVSLS